MENGSSAEAFRVGFTVGEAGGVGPQLLLTFLENEEWKGTLIPIFFGHRRVIERWRSHLGLRSIRYYVIRTPSEAKPESLNLIECGELEEFWIGKASQEAGALARQALIQATEKAAAGEIDLLVTLPADKLTLYDQRTFPYRGHTEYFRAQFPDSPPLMMMVSDQLKVALVTEHIPLREVPDKLSEHLLKSAIRTLNQTLRHDFAIQAPRIAVLGLNPHAGDNGLIGDEEERILKPVITALWEEGIYVGGAFSPDGFFGSRRYRQTDAVLALYHDQGLIPFKLLVGWDGYQYSAGLPFVRTAPDHGTAYDMAGKAEVDLSSLAAAVWEGIAIVRRRRAFNEAVHA